MMKFMSPLSGPGHTAIEKQTLASIGRTLRRHLGCSGVPRTLSAFH
jgi:hypothetical protein